MSKTVRASLRTPLLLTFVATFLFGVGVASAATPLRGSFRGESFGTWANAAAGEISSQLGRSAYLPCPCLGTAFATRSNFVDSVDAGHVFHADAIRTTVRAGKASDGNTADTQHTAKITGMNALDGLIRANVVKAVATTHATKTTITSSSAGSTFDRLRIGGTPISANVAPNTRINLAGFGYVRLKETSRQGNGTSVGGLKVVMIHIYITMTNSLDIPVGAEIIVGHARSGYVRIQSAVGLAGGAWGAEATSSLQQIVDQIGRIAPIYVGCEGTDGTTKTNNVNITSVPGILLTGTAVSTAKSSVMNGVATVKTTARLEDVQLLGGLISAGVARSVSQSSYSDTSGGTTSGSGSTFVNLSVLGLSQPSTIPPNTRIDLPSLGYVVLNEQAATTTPTLVKIRVTAIHIVVTTVNALNIPVGTEIRVAVAYSKAIAF